MPGGVRVIDQFIDLSDVDSSSIVPSTPYLKLNNEGVIEGVVIKEDANYVHNQIAASMTWTINHNLNKYPSVVIVDTAGTLVIGEVNYTSLNQVVVTFTALFSGQAYCN